ncbi:lymphoid enhancer-binding factor 1-like, partial [Thalassophryne amazonica]|uniref:lymphoid enhancer-binding factor 1-like n=1 Tax=Thalassophryne amazonica TaxID=390379 RepID=UPI00147142AD
PCVSLQQTSSAPAVQCPQVSGLKPEVSYGPEALVIQTDSNKYSAIAVKDGAGSQTSETACDFNTAPNTVATLTHVGWLCGDTVYLNNDQVAAPSSSALPQNYSGSRRGRKPKHLQGTFTNTGRPGSLHPDRTGQEAIPGPSSCEPTVLTANPTVGTSSRHQEPDEAKQPSKRPLNAYGVFVREQRESIRAEFNKTNVADVNKILGAKWRALSMHEQFQYYTIAHRESDLGSQ